ncbi:MAG: hypothetical protein PHT41_05180 [Candidatus Omnitrophica bacterium]|nr:hypothetical protein [Candidatus Omnitrophota bacterium]MDD5238179.1 hypothetical protein [Candidatus Omnitrophota bacterium]
MQKRKKYFIEKSFQSKFILKFCLIVIAATFIVGLLLFLFSSGSTTVAIENTKVVVKNTADFILPIILTTLILVTIFSAVSVSLLCLFVSHKIAGPLYRLNSEITKFGEGKLGVNFSIRTGDQLKELANSLENMAASLRGKIGMLKDKCNELLPVSEHSPAKDQIASMKEILDSFKV